MKKIYTSKETKEFGEGRETIRKDLVRFTKNSLIAEGNRARQAPIRNTHDLFLMKKREVILRLELCLFFFFPFLFGNIYIYMYCLDFIYIFFVLL